MISPSDYPASSQDRYKDLMGIRDELRSARLNEQLSTYALAKLVGVSQSTISSVENGLHGARLDVLETWADALGGRVAFVQEDDEMRVAASTLGRDDRRLVLELISLLPTMDPSVKGTIEAMLKMLRLNKRAENP